MKPSFYDGLVSLTNKIINRRSNVDNNQIVSQRIHPQTIRNIIKTGLPNKIISFKSEYATKNGFNFEDEKSTNFYKIKLSKVIKKVVFDMLAYGRGIVVLIEPNVELKDPLVNPNRARVVAFGGDLVTCTSAEFNVSKPNYLKPLFYLVRDKEIHPSRVVDFTYKEVSDYDKPQYQYGGISEIELIYNQLINDGVVERASTSIIERSSTLFYKIEGFKEALAQKKEKHILDFTSKLEDFRSLYGAGIIDSNDDVITVGQVLTHLMDVDTITLRRLSMVTSIPFSILTGERTKGLNSSDEIDREIFNEAIEGIQENYVIEPLTRLMKMFGLSEPTIVVGQNIPDRDRVKANGAVIDNANKLSDMGEDDTASDYLNKNGLTVSRDNPIDGE